MFRIRTSIAILFAGLWLAGAAGAAGAAIVPTSQNRVLSANASASDGSGSDSDTDGATAPDFGPFDDAASASVLLDGAIGSGGGTQSSSLHPEAITASGSHFANGEGWESEAWGDGSGSSRCQVWFDLSEDTDYTLDGWIEEFDSGFTYLTLTGPSGTVHSLSPPHNNTLFIAESGFLVAGSYMLDVRTSGSAFGDQFFPDYASGAYDVTFTVSTATSSPVIAGAARFVAAPNPFRHSTTVSWRNAGSTDVTIHDPAGRLVRRISAGDGTDASWDGRDANGRRMPSGVYFVTAIAAGETRRTKVTLVR